MDKEKLKNDYENACNAYLKAFCEKHEFYGLDNPETFLDRWPSWRNSQLR